MITLKDFINAKENSGGEDDELLMVAFENELVVTGDPVADARAVCRLCEQREPQRLDLSTGDVSLRLRLLDSDAVKSCFVTLASTIETQSKDMECIRASLNNLQLKDDSDLRQSLATLQSNVSNLAQNMQGFAEDDEPAAEEDEPAEEQTKPLLEENNAPVASSGEKSAAVQDDDAQRKVATPSLSAEKATDEDISNKEDGAMDHRTVLKEDEGMEEEEEEEEEATSEVKTTEGNITEEQTTAQTIPSKEEHTAASEEKPLAEVVVAKDDKLASSQPETSAATSKPPAVENVQSASTLRGGRLRRQSYCETEREQYHRHKDSVLKSRAPTGQSIADRLRRLEEHVFVEFKRVRETVEANSEQDALRDAEISELRRQIDDLEVKQRDIVGKLQAAIETKERDATERNEHDAIEDEAESLPDTFWDDVEARLQGECETVETILSGLKTATDKLRSQPSDDKVWRRAVEHDFDIRKRREELATRYSELAVLRDAVRTHRPRNESQGNIFELVDRVDSLHAKARKILKESDSIAREAWLMERQEKPMPVVVEQRIVEVPSRVAVSLPTPTSTDDSTQQLQSFTQQLQSFLSNKLEVHAKATENEIIRLTRESEAASADLLDLRDLVENAMRRDDAKERLSVCESGISFLKEAMSRPTVAAAPTIQAATPIHLFARKDEVASLDAKIRAQLDAQAQQISALFARKADKNDLQLDLDKKLDKSDEIVSTATKHKELEKSLDRVKKELTVTRSSVEKEYRVLKRQVESLSLKRDVAAVTTMCLTCSRETVPETARDAESLTHHRRLLPRLNEEIVIHDSQISTEYRSEVYRGGFRMPLQNRPGTSPKAIEDPLRPLIAPTVYQPQGPSQQLLLSTSSSANELSPMEGYAPPPGHHHSRLEGKVVRLVDVQSNATERKRRGNKHVSQVNEERDAATL